MSGLWQDVRGAVGAVIGMRVAGVVAVLTLALGIGASTTMFGVVDAMLLRPVPFDDPGALVTVSLTRTSPRDALERLRFSYHEFENLAARATAFERLAASSRTSTVAVDVPEPTQVDGEIVSPGYLEVLRVHPILGGTFDGLPPSPGPRPVVIISARLWRDRLQADPDVIGRALTVDGVRLTVVGVLPLSFAGLSERAEIWLPAEMAPTLTYAEYLTTPQHFITVIGRLKAGVSLARANAELAVLGPSIANPDHPDPNPAARFSATSMLVNDARRRPAAERSAWLLTAAIVCVLLIACANVTSLLLARLHDRQREIAIRKALGGSTARVVRQLVVESAMVAGAGGVLGLGISTIGTRLVARAAPTWLPSLATGAVQISSFAQPQVDGGIALFAIAVTTGITVLFAIAAGWDARGAMLADVLRDDRRTGTGRRLRTLRALVAAEVATAMVLCTGAALLVERRPGDSRAAPHEHSGCAGCRGRGAQSLHATELELLVQLSPPSGSPRDARRRAPLHLARLLPRARHSARGRTRVHERRSRRPARCRRGQRGHRAPGLARTESHRSAHVVRHDDGLHRRSARGRGRRRRRRRAVRAVD
jgi:predicted permease